MPLPPGEAPFRGGPASEPATAEPRRARLGLGAKLSLTITLVLVTIASGLFLVLELFLRQRVEALVQAETAVVAQVVELHARHVLNDRSRAPDTPETLDELQRALELAARFSQIEWVEVFDVNAIVVAHSLPGRRGHPPLEQHRKAVHDVLESGHRLELEEPDGRRAAFVPIRAADAAGGPVAVIGVAEILHAQDAPALLNETRGSLALVLVLGTAAAAGALLVGLRQLVTRPVARLGDLARQLADGNLEARVGGDDGDEIGRLGRVFDDMARQLQERAAARNEAERELRHLAAELEERVAARTAELAAAHDRLKQLIEHMPILVSALDDAGRIVLWNAECERVTGYSASEIVGNPDWHGRLYPDPARQAELIAERERRRGAFRDWEVELTARDGSRRVVSWSSIAARYPVPGWSQWSAGIDVTQRREDERRQQLLVRELDHRVKNNLATVLALARRTFDSSTSLESFRSGFLGRITAMARTHEGLAASHWRGLSLEAVSRLALAPYLAPGTDRFRLRGEPVLLSADVAVPLGLALHELATNAVKHGALSTVGGRVDLSWVRDGRRISLVWEECDGPPVPLPWSAGTGTRLIEGLLRHELQGDLEFSGTDQGFVFTAFVPLAGGARS